MNRVFSYISNCLVIPIGQGIQRYVLRNRFGTKTAGKEEREYQKILDFLDDHPGFLRESHKPTKLVTVHHRADNPLDPLRYPLPYTEKESRMDTPPRPPRLRKPPSQNVEQKLELQPITFREACAYVEKYHRHHRPPQGHKFSIAVNDGEKIVGVVMVGRPVSRHLDDGWTAEVTRCCTTGTPNTNSILYAAAWRAARGMGYRKLITYILDSEPGTSLRAAGWKLIGKRGGGSWSRPGRPRVDTHPTGQKLLFEVMA